MKRPLQIENPLFSFRLLNPGKWDIFMSLKWSLILPVSQTSLLESVPLRPLLSSWDSGKPLMPLLKPWELPYQYNTFSYFLPWVIKERLLQWEIWWRQATIGLGAWLEAEGDAEKKEEPMRPGGFVSARLGQKTMPSLLMTIITG